MADKTDGVSFVHKGALGNVRLRDEANNVILVPTPSNDPADPLNWPKPYRYYIAGLVSLAIFLSNFVAAAPSVALIDMTTDYFGPPGPDLSGNITKISYFITTTTLLQGIGNLIWMPLVLKFGRRPVYVLSFLLFTATCFWAGGAKSYASTLTARIFLGFSSGATECLAPLTISDTFFLHERGTIMAIYSMALSAGVGFGIVIAGLITIDLDWRYIYWVSGSLVGACTLLMIFTFPETEFKRDKITDTEATNLQMGPRPLQKETAEKRTYLQGLSLYSGIHTQESFLKLFVRPIVLIILPPVLWATLVMSANVGFLVAVTSNYATAFSTLYNFKPWQSGLCFIAGPIGALVGNICGGYVSDRTADYSTKRNHGIREPEMRLPAIIFSVIASPLSLVLYGVGIANEYHWIVPTIGIGMLTFSVVQATNITLVYTIDAYRPIAGEVAVTQYAYKSLIGFLLSFYTNPWIAKDGYAGAFGAMAGITGGIILLGIPVYVYGKRIRHTTWNWGFIRNFAHWDEDREVGE
ncbi:major facilitator superfamily domain-containing protein [Dactylonectria estremocensis]|uniref:Major facilitator superfamily domain-containing protein n=1 Tax=Dactylonectria estremocensis TaxID=1079267 RepID=A0A9P9EVH5_9HYPO|nr:major facilitator superfamily domain-containing protein [Dactylonectria estremocensis]